MELNNVLNSYECRFERFEIDIFEMIESSGKIRAKFLVSLHVQEKTDADSVFLVYNAAFQACALQGWKQKLKKNYFLLRK